MTNALSHDILKTAEWRDRKAERYPEDWRNAVAAKRLRELSEAALADPALEDECDMLCNEVDAEELSDACSEVFRSIGFSFDPASPDEVAKRILASVDRHASA